MRSFGSIRSSHFYGIVLLALLAIHSFPIALFGRVVINELCYDPSGVDDNKEWIELYNAGDVSINLSGCKILSGGSNFVEDYTFPYFILRPGRYVLVGGSAVTNTHFTHPFHFQNGTNGTDGVRFQSADGTYTDTVLYTAPNVNLLFDDSGNPGTSFASAATNGKSLARVMDGWDMDLCADDFLIEQNPTPGLPNRVYSDYSVGNGSISSETPNVRFYIKNVSLYTPSAYAQLQVSEDSYLLHEAQIAPINAGDSLLVELLITIEVQNLKVQVDLENDTNTLNNTMYLSTTSDDLNPPIINEIFPIPQSGKQEWIELYQSTTSRLSAKYILKDAAGNRTAFSLPPVPGYFVICSNSDAFLLDYPLCSPDRIIKTNSWAMLNNDGDALYLFDEDEQNLLDTMSYTASQVATAKSLERYLGSSSDINWRISLDASGATPGMVNSSPGGELPVQDKQVQILGSPFDPNSAEQLKISYSLPASSNRVNCFVYELSGVKVRTLADNSLVTERGIFAWDGKKQNGKMAKRGLYIILWESQPSSGGKIYRKQLTAVLK